MDDLSGNHLQHGEKNQNVFLTHFRKQIKTKIKTHKLA